MRRWVRAGVVLMAWVVSGGATAAGPESPEALVQQLGGVWPRLAARELAVLFRPDATVYEDDFPRPMSLHGPAGAQAYLRRMLGDPPAGTLACSLTNRIGHWATQDLIAGRCTVTLGSRSTTRSFASHVVRDQGGWRFEDFRIFDATP